MKIDKNECIVALYKEDKVGKDFMSVFSTNYLLLIYEKDRFNSSFVRRNPIQTLGLCIRKHSNFQLSTIIGKSLETIAH